MSKAINALFPYVFEAGGDDYPSSDSEILFLNVDFSSFNEFGNGHVSYYHPHAGAAQKWNRRGDFISENDLNAGAQNFDFIFYAMPKNKIEARYFMALIHQNLTESGKVIMAAANDAGGKGLVKMAVALGLTGQDYSKSKCRILVAEKHEGAENDVQLALKEGARQKIEIAGDTYMSQAGVFGWNKIDTGSKLLVEYIPSDLSGIGADFGCGYGYLSRQILGRCGDIKKLHAIDVDTRSVQAAAQNLAAFEDKAQTHWADLTNNSPIEGRIDFIVMNPPFHEGKSSKVDLGMQFIERAYDSLKKNGALYMVANSHLAYEKHLARFGMVEKLAETHGFKIFKALR